ncbi:MAG: hemerythrin domain-containing protein [Hyphomicrobiaceae bacterium]
MSFTNRISQALHEEHRATVALMERLELLLVRHRREPPDTAAGGVAQLLGDLATGVEADVRRHFDFEESRLFAYLDAVGDQAIGEHLTDEHGMMRPLGTRLAEVARDAVSRGFDEARWAEFRRLGQEFCERVIAHVQKEEMALLPLLEETMDADAEMQLYEEYVANV